MSMSALNEADSNIIFIRVVHDKIKNYIVRQNFHQTYFNNSENNPSPEYEMVHETNFS